MQTKPGIYFAASKDGVTFQEPVLLHKCESYCRRAYDLSVQGNVSFKERGIEFYVHRNFPCRMVQKDQQRKEKLVKISKDLPSHISKLWQRSSTTGE